MPPLDADSVKRFSRPDIAEVVRTLWSTHQGHCEVRVLLLQLIWLGALKDCADLAADAAFGRYQDRQTRLVAGRAIAVTGDEATKQAYAQFIKAGCTALPLMLVWDAIDGLFPKFLSVDDFLTILGAVDVTDRDASVRFEWRSADLVKRLNCQSDLERLLRGLLEQVGGEIGNLDRGYPPNKRDEAYIPAIAAVACRLFECCSEDEVPVLAIDAAL